MMLNKETIKNIAYYVANLPYRILSMLASLSNTSMKRVFVNCFDGKSLGDNPDAIVRELINRRNDVKIYWLCHQGMKYSIDDKNIIYLKNNTFKHIYFMTNSRIWISNVRMPFWSCKKRKTKYFQTWHGSLPIKKIEGECVDKLSKRYVMQAKHDSKMNDYIISECADNTVLYEKYFWLKHAQVLKVGAPRNDIFFRDNNDLIHLVKEKLGVKGEKVILYVPTFREERERENHFLDYSGIRKALEVKFGGSWSVLLRLHPRYSNTDIDRFEDVINVTNYPDIQQLLIISDILLTDYSSVCMDFLLTKRPAFLLARDIEVYRKERGFHIELDETPFPISHSEEELINNIRNFDEVEYQNDVNKFLGKYGYYDDGYAAKKVVDVIESLL